jgi:tetratricopeptide (TPR) repeat protein
MNSAAKSILIEAFKTMKFVAHNGLRVIFVALLLTIATRMALAEPEKMDVGTHRFLIEKLESVLDSTPKGDVTRVPALLRLADLYSDEARLLSMTEIEKGCFQGANVAGCGLSKSDRASAIKFYEMALSESSGAIQSRVLFQLAHLYEVNGQSKQASNLYRKILALGAKRFSQTVLGQSQAGLGEIAFKEKRFRDAKKSFELAMKNPATPRRGWIMYRLAWSELNLNQAEMGKRRLLTILKTPSLLSLESTSGSKQDSSFQEDVAHDLTVFYARTGFSQQDIESLWALSPEAARKSILIELAEEAERLGQKRAAIAVWSTLASRPVDNSRLGTNGLLARERIEAQTRVATLRFGLGEKPQAVVDFRGAITLWNKTSCSPEAECAILQKRLRKLVIDWNKNEETKLSKELLEMYRLFAGQFPQDSEMAFWGANVARERQANREAMALYHQAAEEASKAIARGDAKSDPKIKTVFEGSLLAEIEMSELTKDLKLREQAYNHYLTLNPQGPKSLEVRYQLAHTAYDRGEIAKAADMFYQIAARDEACRSKSVPSFCRQSADLALDSIVILKQDERLEATALEFATLYSGGKDFSSIARRARLNMAAKAANGSSSSAMNENLKKLSEMNLKDAPASEVLLTHRNRFVLAEKTRNFAAASAAAVAIINYPGASASEREDAMAKRLWVAEMQLDFATAYVTAKQMKMAGTKPAERELKLALLAELSGRDARPHLKQFISMTHDRKAELSARVKLVKASNYSTAEFNRHFSALKRDVELLASVGLDVYARHPSARLAKQMLSVRGLQKTAEGGVLVRSGELKMIERFAKRLASAHLPANASDKTLQKALASRVRTLAEADAFANKAIKSQDGWLQALALQTVAVENRRLKDEILSLPSPKGLKPADLRRYQTLMARQVAPFEIKALKIDQKLAKFWIQEPAERLARTLEQSIGAKRTLLAKEARAMVQVLDLLDGSIGPKNAMKRLNRAIESEVPAVQAKTLASARDDVRDNPFDVDTLKRLRSLEAEAGRDTMVAYLDSRMNRLGARP